jgi:hypothetical protein
MSAFTWGLSFPGSSDGIVVEMVLNMSCIEKPAHRKTKSSPFSAGARSAPCSPSLWQLLQLSTRNSFFPRAACSLLYTPSHTLFVACAATGVTIGSEKKPYRHGGACGGSDEESHP